MPKLPPKITGFHVYRDESDTDSGKRYMVYGGIIVADNNLPRIEREIANWRITHKMHRELKWVKVSKKKYSEYRSLMDLFFSLASHGRLLHFKAFIVDTRAAEYRVFSRGDNELGFYKFYYQFLLRYFAVFPHRHHCGMDVIIDDRDVRRDHLSVLHIVLNHGIKKMFNVTNDLVKSVEPITSHESNILQVADVLMGAVGFHNNGRHLRPAAKHKVDLAAYIATRGALRDLTQETPYTKTYFKIARWHWGPGPRPSRRRHPSRRRAPSSNL